MDVRKMRQVIGNKLISQCIQPFSKHPDSGKIFSMIFLNQPLQWMSEVAFAKANDYHSDHFTNRLP